MAVRPAGGGEEDRPTPPADGRLGKACGRVTPRAQCSATRSPRRLTPGQPRFHVQDKVILGLSGRCGGSGPAGATSTLTVACRLGADRSGARRKGGHGCGAGELPIVMSIEFHGRSSGVRIIDLRPHSAVCSRRRVRMSCRKPAACEPVKYGAERQQLARLPIDQSGRRFVVWQNVLPGTKIRKSRDKECRRQSDTVAQPTANATPGLR